MVQWARVGVVLRCVVRGSVWDVGCWHVIRLPRGLVGVDSILCLARLAPLSSLDFEENFVKEKKYLCLILS